MKKAKLKRISKDISTEVKGLKQLLKAIEKEPERYEKFVKNPKKDLKAFGIDTAKYASKSMPEKVIREEIIKITQQAIRQGIISRIQSLVDIVSKTEYSRSTETSYEYNFDHSSHTDYKYESHTGTERGTFSETSSGQAMKTDTGFNGIDLTVIDEMMHGPLISEGVMKEIIINVEKTLGQAQQIVTKK